MPNWEPLLLTPLVLPLLNDSLLATVELLLCLRVEFCSHNLALLPLPREEAPLPTAEDTFHEKRLRMPERFFVALMLS